jgi:hypothetical protein
LVVEMMAQLSEHVFVEAKKGRQYWHGTDTVRRNLDPDPGLWKEVLVIEIVV